MGTLGFHQTPISKREEEHPLFTIIIGIKYIAPLTRRIIGMSGGLIDESYLVAPHRLTS